MQSASRQAVKSCSEAVGLRVVQARSGGRTCRGKKGCRVSRVDFAHGWAKSFTRVATLRRPSSPLSQKISGTALPVVAVAAMGSSWCGAWTTANTLKSPATWPPWPRSRQRPRGVEASSRLHQGLAVVECPWGVMRMAKIGIPAVALLGTHLSRSQVHSYVGPLASS